MDARFSPSQFDDPDHHLALLQAGYEVLDEGRVRVAHKLNNGLARSHAAIANQIANQSKMRGKWGADVYEISSARSICRARAATSLTIGIRPNGSRGALRLPATLVTNRDCVRRWSV